MNGLFVEKWGSEVKNTKEHLMEEIKSLLERATPDQMKIILRFMQGIVRVAY